MDDLRAILDSLEDAKLEYVIERSKVRSDAEALRNAGVARSTFYGWEDRERLTEYAQRLKRETHLQAVWILRDAVVEAARVKVDALKSKRDPIRQAAATEILDRILGKPTQRQEVTGRDGGPVEHRFPDFESALDKAYGDSSSAESTDNPA